MTAEFYPQQTELRDLSVCMYGMEQCQSAHAFGPAARDYFLVHYIRSGKGEFRFDRHSWQLERGQGFLICPDQITYYQADMEDPWQYVWIGFKGSSAENYIRRGGLSQETPVFGRPGPDRDPWLDGLFSAIDCTRQGQQGAEVRLLGLLHLFLAHLMANNPLQQPDVTTISRRQWYVRQAINILETNDHRRVGVSELAREIGLDRSYFGAIFREITGKSPQQFSLQLRMEKARRLLARQDLTIAAVARSVGYEDPLLFSRMFRRSTGLSPSRFRHYACQQKT